MKLKDILFWIFLAAVAFFYLFKGNDMYTEKREKINQVFSQDSNTTIK
ncbi:MAG: hypothetical protein K8R39_04165 [Arcobacteraceae bacterium]|nr:hypothetical protein [Arcobacteraceae bacterium]